MGKELRPRRRGSHRRATPYDRPLNAVRNNISYDDSSNENGRSWFLKVLSPFASGAGKLFSSVFRRENSGDSSPSDSSSSDDETDNNSDNDEDKDPEDNVHGLVAMKDGTVIEVDIQGEPSSAANSKLSEVENLLTSKTFTRDEFIHLTALLRSRVVDSAGLQYKSPEHCRSFLRNDALEEAQRWREERRKAYDQSEIGGLDSGLCGNVSSLALSADVPDNAETSPVDIAKAYMGVRPTWASSSPLALQSYKSRESNSVKSVSFAPTTNESWPVRNSELEDRFRTPTPSRLWNRMQGVAYDPYYRVGYSQTPYYRDVYSQQSIQNDNAVDSGTPTSSWTPIQSSTMSGREILKRRSSVVDDGWAHAGPIRRIRQKSFGNIPLVTTPHEGFHSSLKAGSSSSLFSLEAFRNSSINKKNMEICGVPSHSTLTAHKILGNRYGNIASSNEKSGEEQLALAKENTSNPMTMTETTNKGDGKAPQAETIASAIGASAMLEGKDLQANMVEGLGRKAHGSGEDAITHDVQTLKSVSIASDGDLNSSSHPTFKFGSGDTNKGPVFSFTTNGTPNLDMDASNPKFDFKFESKRGTLFSAAVEAAVASQSSPQSALSKSPHSTSYSASAGSRLGLLSESTPAILPWTSSSKSISSSPFSSTLFGRSSVSFQSTSSSLFSTDFTNLQSSPGFFGFSKIGASQVGTGNLPAFGSGSNSLFGLTSTANFSTGTSTYASATAGSFSSGAPVFSSSGIGNLSTLAFGSSITSTNSSSTAFTMNNIASFKSNSTPSLFSVSLKSSGASSISFGTSPQIGSGTPANNQSNKPDGLVESVETAVGTSVPQTSRATDITNSTSALGDTSIALTAVVDGLKGGKMNGNDLKVTSKLSRPLQSVTASAEQTSSSTFSPTSVAVTIDSQSNAESSEGQLRAPSQNFGVSGAQTSFASAGNMEITGNGGDKRGRKIVRPKRDRTRRK